MIEIPNPPNKIYLKINFGYIRMEVSIEDFLQRLVDANLDKRFRMIFSYYNYKVELITEMIEFYIDCETPKKLPKSVKFGMFLLKDH